MKITLDSTPQHPIVLGSFPDLFRVGTYQGAPTNYSAQLLLPKDSPQLAQLQKAVSDFAAQQWGDAAKTALAKQERSNSKVFRDGDSVDGQTAEGNFKPGWQGHVRIKASNKQSPKVVDQSLRVLDESAGLPFAGCAVNAQIEIYAFKDKKELGFRLLVVQHVAEGPRLGGGASSAPDMSAFKVLTDEIF